MDPPPQIPGVYLVPDLFGGHLIFLDAVDPANVEFYLAMIGLEATVRAGLMASHSYRWGRRHVAS